METADNNFKGLTKDNSITSSLKDSISTEQINQIKDTINSVQEEFQI